MPEAKLQENILVINSRDKHTANIPTAFGV